MISSMYAEYAKERQGVETLETDWGFVQYLIDGEEIYISDMFVHSDFRGFKKSFEMADKINEIGKENNCKMLTCQCIPNTFGSRGAMLTILRYGFKPFGIKDDAVLFVKEIE